MTLTKHTALQRVNDAQKALDQLFASKTLTDNQTRALRHAARILLEGTALAITAAEKEALADLSRASDMVAKILYAVAREIEPRVPTSSRHDVAFRACQLWAGRLFSLCAEASGEMPGIIVG